MPDKPVAASKLAAGGCELKRSARPKQCFVLLSVPGNTSHTLRDCLATEVTMYANADEQSLTSLSH